jgi:hypothetical protein
MNTRKTLALAVLLAALVLYLTKVSLPHRERVASERMAFSRLQVEDVTRIEVRRAASAVSDAEIYAIARSGAPAGASGVADLGWIIEGIRGARADSISMKEMVEGLQQLSVEGPLNDKDMYSDLAKYGLDKPVLTTIVQEKGGATTEVAFGKENQYLLKRYVKVSGRSGVFLVEGTAFAALNKGIGDIRSKTPFDFKDDDVRMFTLSTGEARIVVSQPVVGEWKIVEPINSKASSEDVQALLTAIRGLRAEDFLQSPANKRGDFGLNTPRVTVELTFPEGAAPARLVMMLSEPVKTDAGVPVVYASSSESDSIFKLPSDPIADLSKRVNDLRFKEVVAMPASVMEKIVSSGAADTSVTIASAGVSWTVNGKESDLAFVDQLLNDISALKAVAFPEAIPADAFTDPFLSLAITKKGDDKQLVTVTIGKEFKSEAGETLRYARSSASEVVFGVRDVEAKRVVPHEEALVPAKTPTPGPTQNSVAPS